MESLQKLNVMQDIAALQMNSRNSDAYLELSKIKLDKKPAKYVQLVITAMRAMIYQFLNPKNAQKVTIAQIFRHNLARIQILLQSMLLCHALSEPIVMLLN